MTTLTIYQEAVIIEIAAEDTATWARRGWPDAALAGHAITARCDSGGLYDYEVGKGLSAPSDELNALTTELLHELLPREHPAYYVAAGQFYGEPYTPAWEMV